VSTAAAIATHGSNRTTIPRRQQPAGHGPGESMMSEPATIRRATPEDARALAELIEIAGDGIPTYLWSQMAAPGESPLDVGERRARRDSGNFSWRHATVAEADGRVAGMVLAYPLAPDDRDAPAASDLPDLLRPFLELERLVSGSYYINAFALYPEHRARGTGSRLLLSVLDAARESGCPSASVQYFSQNPRAGVFYQRHGFREVDSRRLVPHPASRYDDRTILLVRELD